MKNWNRLKQKAALLRKQGFSYNEIRKHVPVAKSTLSLWLKEIPLSEKHKKRLYTKQIQILSRGSASQKERRAREIEGLIERAIKEIQVPIDPQSYQLMGAALYWAEGSKGKRCSFTNSDPHMILFFVRWVERVLYISSCDLKARLNIYPQQDEQKIKEFWSDLTGVPLENFGKSYVKPLSTGFKKNNLYYGTINIGVPRGTDLRLRIYGWVQAVLKTIDPVVAETQRKWVSLTNTSRPVNIRQK